MATGRSVLHSDHLKQDPGNGARRDETRVRRGGGRVAQTLLVSRECCHVERGMPLSNGLALRKWVRICLLLSLNRVARGPKKVQAKPEPEGRQM